MIICRTPYRISLFGGGSDYPTWLKQNQGCVLSTTINKYCYLTCRYLPPFFDHKIRVVYSKIELCKKTSEITHPAVRAALQKTKTRWGVEIHHDGDIPARSGMGSSSSFAVGILNALWTLQGKATAKKVLAQAAIDLEQKMLQESVGCQDQIAAAYGGLNIIKLHNTRDFNVTALPLTQKKEDQLLAHLLLLYTGTGRNATDIAKGFIPTLVQNERQINRMIALVDIAKNCLLKGTISDIGYLLDEAWQLKRSLGTEISNNSIDTLYTAAKKLGATGGKILGAGGGGFLLLFAKPEYHQRIIKALPALAVPFTFEKAGSQIILYEPELNFEKNLL